MSLSFGCGKKTWKNSLTDEWFLFFFSLKFHQVKDFAHKNTQKMNSMVEFLLIYTFLHVKTRKNCRWTPRRIRLQNENRIFQLHCSHLHQYIFFFLIIALLYHHGTYFTSNSFPFLHLLKSRKEVEKNISNNNSFFTRFSIIIFICLIMNELNKNLLHFSVD